MFCSFQQCLDVSISMKQIQHFPDYTRIPKEISPWIFAAFGQYRLIFHPFGFCIEFCLSGFKDADYSISYLVNDWKFRNTRNYEDYGLQCVVNWQDYHIILRGL